MTYDITGQVAQRRIYCVNIDFTTEIVNATNHHENITIGDLTFTPDALTGNISKSGSGVVAHQITLAGNYVVQSITAAETGELPITIYREQADKTFKSTSSQNPRLVIEENKIIIEFDANPKWNEVYSRNRLTDSISFPLITFNE